jgi:fused signal recognition particle receptor
LKLLLKRRRPVPATAGPPLPEEKKSIFTKVKEKFTKKEEVKKEEAVTAVPATKKVEPSEASSPPEAEKAGFFERIKQTITTKTISTEKFEELFWDLELALLENNVSVEVMERIKDDLKEELVEKPLPRDVEGKIAETLKKTLQEILSFDRTDLVKQIKQHQKQHQQLREQKPYVIAFFGINGSGKTTTIAKLAHHLQRQGLSVVLAAGDTFRAAAIQQLEEHAQRLKIRVIKHDYGADAAAVAFDAVKFAEKNQVEVVLIDTAGRLHSNTNLMQELEKIIRVAKPNLKLFVGESITGNDCIEQARQFNELVELDGSILTKADVDEKGGAPLSIAYTIKKPILFLGTGQRYEDLEVFEKDIILERLGL